MPPTAATERVAWLRTLKNSFAELQNLPEDWTIDVDDQSRVYFKKSDGNSTYNHPQIGGLPKPWILKVYGNEVWYYNRDSRTKAKRDPRLMSANLIAQASVVPKNLWIAASSQRNENVDLSKMERSPISRVDIRGSYDIVHTIDPGDGTKGGMNGGVFVVRMKNLPTRLFIEKRFKAEQLEVGKAEIDLIRKLNHSALTNYSAAAFVDQPNLKMASLYIEFCDRGSLDDLIRAYKSRQTIARPPPIPPEAFIWHAFGGLLDALVYLQIGTGLLHLKNPSRPARWTPMLHRDMKPDNVLLRSRSTVGSKKYFYCVLSDFGLMCADLPPSHPDCDPYQRSRAKLGTMIYLSPEQLYDPYPRTPQEQTFFPVMGRHSRKTDVYALGLTIYNLCHPAGGPAGHMDFSAMPKGMDGGDYSSGVASRKVIRGSAKYSSFLAKAVERATRWNPIHRPDAVTLIKDFENLQEAAGFTKQRESDPLPDWATKKHDYFAKAEQAKNASLS